MTPEERENIIERAKAAILATGWELEEEEIQGERCYLAFLKNGKHLGWGMYDRLNVWMDAYEALTKRSFLSLRSAA